MRLDVGGPSATTGLDNVWIEGALHKELDRLPLADPPRRIFEDANELAADDLALRLRIVDAGKGLEKAIGRIDDFQPHPGRRDKVTLDLFSLTGTQQAMVDEHTRELRPD